MELEPPDSQEIAVTLRREEENLRCLAALNPADRFYVKAAEQLASIAGGLEEREPTREP